MALKCVGKAGIFFNYQYLSYFSPNLKGVTYRWLGWLSLTNILTLLSAVPFIISKLYDTYRSYTLAWILAHVSLPAINGFMASSVYITITISIDRYLATCCPLMYQNFHSHQTMMYCVIISYCLGFLFNLPLVIYSKVKKMKHHVFRIEINPIRYEFGFTLYIYFSEMVLRVLPIVILAVLNIKIIKRLKELRDARHDRLAVRRSTSSKADSNQIENLTKKSEENRVTILLLSLVVFNLVTSLPAAFLLIIQTFRDMVQCSKFHIFSIVANNLESLNFACNFYVYCMCSSEFRRMSKKILKEKIQCIFFRNFNSNEVETGQPVSCLYCSENMVTR